MKAFRTLLLLALLADSVNAQSGAPRRPTIGVAFGGGSARGFAHVGVIRWFEEHRIPIDLAAGTSMGALIGGSYAAGMNAEELTALLDATDWDVVFGSTPYRFRSIARKQDARGYPSRLQLHVRSTVGLPNSLNNGEEVDFLLSRVGALYGSLPSFDSLPTPFRCIALDLRTGEAIVLDKGSLSIMMRSSMSLPGVFPPMHVDDYVLVDGGAMNNVPADVVRGMGADVVVAVTVGAMLDTNPVGRSIGGIVNNTISAMQRANTRRGMAAADLVIHPDLTGLTGGDWTRSREFEAKGYAAAERMKDKLLPLAVDSATWLRYTRRRAAKRRSKMPMIVAIEVTGATPADERLLRRRMKSQVGKPLDIERVEEGVRRFSGLDRYLTVGWDLVERNGSFVLLVRARRLATAPPLLMSVINVESRMNDDYQFEWASRFLALDWLSAGSETRLDLTLGTQLKLGGELRAPILGPLFLAGSVIGRRDVLNFFQDDAVVAQYTEREAYGLFDVGLSWRDVELRAGVLGGHYDVKVRVGDPVLPTIEGRESQLRLLGIFDTQDAAVIPSRGLRLVASARHYMSAADPDRDLPSGRTDEGLYQAEIEGSTFHSWSERRNRVFAVAGGGTSFGDNPLPTEQFALGLPLRLDAFSLGERRGDHFGALTLGYLRSLMELPGFLAGPSYVGAWLQGGSAWDVGADAQVDVQLGVGAIAETLIGPGIVGYSLGSGARRFYVGFGRLFR